MITYKSLKDIAFTEFYPDLEAIAWTQFYRLNDVDKMLKLVNDFLLELFDKHAPEKTVVVKEAQKPWRVTWQCEAYVASPK